MFENLLARQKPVINLTKRLPKCKPTVFPHWFFVCQRLGLFYFLQQRLSKFLNFTRAFIINHNYANVWTINQSKPLPGFRVVTSLDGINCSSIQTSLMGVCDSKGCLKFKLLKPMKTGKHCDDVTTFCWYNVAKLICVRDIFVKDLTYVYLTSIPYLPFS